MMILHDQRSKNAMDAGDEVNCRQDVIEWCREYISVTTALNDYIEHGNISEANSLLDQRQGLIDRLPEVTQKSPPQENGSLNRMIETIKTLDSQGQRMINNKIDNVARDMGNVHRYKRSLNYSQQTEAISRFIDKRS